MLFVCALAARWHFRGNARVMIVISAFPSYDLAFFALDLSSQLIFMLTYPLEFRTLTLAFSLRRFSIFWVLEPAHFAQEIAMARKRKRQSATVPIIPPIDPNSQLPFVGNHMSVVLESDLLHLVETGVLPPKELCSWWIWHGVTVPTADTHEAIVFVPFLIWGLALPASPFFCDLLDFYDLNLTHLNPNSILQIAIFVHLFEDFLGILPHFGL
jgi:hypothetical protein